MRVLVASVPASGHVLPMIPLARRLQQSGHEVLWATGPDQCENLAGGRVRDRAGRTAD